MTGLQACERAGIAFLEGTPQTAVMATGADASRLLEACFSAHSRRALLYASNLPPGFFDVSSLVAGDVLQKLRTFRVRLAVVREPGTPPPSTRFHELLAAERREPYFDVFDTRDAAVAWLTADGGLQASR